MHSVGTGWLWFGFFVFVLLVLAADMFLLGGAKSKPVSMRKAFSWTLIWFSCAMVFNYVLWVYVSNTQGPVIAAQKALEFLTGYLVEESLSFDNMFAILMIFNFFCVPHLYQRRTLLYGVLGAIVMRLIMILAGAWLISQFHWVLYLFGIFLVYTGIKMFSAAESEPDLAQNGLLKWLRNHIRITDTFHEEKFFVKQNLLWYATPLFLVLVLIEASDLVFALDSIPAIFAITKDPFIVFTSNIFAILGLRAIYFLLANLAHRFDLLKYGIALVLMFIGAKMLIEPWFKVPIVWALSVVAVILVSTIVLSLLQKKRNLVP
jgi:tellurite resistance protein TerC